MGLGLLLALATGCRTPAPPSPGAASPVWQHLRARYDADGDGRIEPAEYTRSPGGFANLDADGDQLVTAADFEPRFDGAPRGPWTSFDEFERSYGEGGPALGDVAPPFRLVTTDGGVVALAEFRGVRPVALVFGSYT